MISRISKKSSWTPSTKYTKLIPKNYIYNEKGTIFQNRMHQIGTQSTCLHITCPLALMLIVCMSKFVFLINIYIYIYIKKQRPRVGKYEVQRWRQKFLFWWGGGEVVELIYLSRQPPSPLPHTHTHTHIYTHFFYYI